MGSTCCHQLLLLLLLLLFASTAGAALRKCLVHLRLSTSSGKVEKDIKDFSVIGKLDTCKKAERLCSYRLMQQLRRVLGEKLLPIGGSTHKDLCEMFDMDLEPSDNGILYAVYKASGCTKESTKFLGRMCCWKCAYENRVLIVPNDNCHTTSRPSWCR